MRSLERIPTGSNWIGLAFYGVGLAMVFWIPWHVGGLSPVAGQSYEFGFNNRFACIALGVLLLAYTAVRIWLLAPASQQNFLACLEIEPRILPNFREARTEYLVLFLTGILVFCGHLWWNSFLILPYWGGELAYFLSRLDLVSMGLQPHADFRFNYGPALLYLPYWLSTFSGGELAIEDAYAWFLAASFVLGLIMVFVFLRCLQIPKRFRPLVLLLALLMWIALTMGLNYSPMRFTLVSAVLVLFHRLIRVQDESKASPWKNFLGALVGSAICLWVSPEMGLACLAGFLGYGFIVFLSGRKGPAFAILVGGAGALGLVGFGSPDYFYGVRSFSSGGYNFPIFPNLTNLLLFFCALWVIPGMLASAWRGHQDVRAPLAAALMGAATFLLPAAYGRCDPGHIAINGYSLYMLMFAWAANFSAWGLRVWSAIFGLVFVGLAQVSYWSHYQGLFREALQIHEFFRAQPSVLEQWRSSWAWLDTRSGLRSFSWRKVAPPPPNLDEWLEGRTVGLPLGGDLSLERYLKKQPGFRTLYHQSPAPDWFSPADIDRALADCLKINVLLVPRASVESAQQGLDHRQYEMATQKFVSGLMLFPVSIRMKNEPYFPDRDLVRRLLIHCDLEVVALEGWIGLRPRARASRP